MMRPVIQTLVQPRLTMSRDQVDTNLGVAILGFPLQHASAGGRNQRFNLSFVVVLQQPMVSESDHDTDMCDSSSLMSIMQTPDLT